MTKEKGTIKKYNPSMAKEVAEMFNTFHELWPGGFGGGTPYDEQRVRDWLDNSTAIADLIALDAEGTPVGYCGLYPHWKESNVAYINIIGVTPSVLGKKFGKRLLLKALEVAKEKGIYRVDLHTWSGNMKAVPLYKKVGLFWVPDTSVYMQDYIPGLLNISFARKWFDKHPDWYGCFERELKQQPDADKVDNMQIYQYKFTREDDLLIAEVDRYGFGFCGFSRKLDGKTVLARTKLEDHHIHIGIENSLTISLLNESGNDVNISLDIKPFKGLKFTESFPQTVFLQNGESIEITRKFIVNKSAKLFEGDQNQNEKITTRISFDNENIQLITSGKIQSAVEISFDKDVQILPRINDETTIIDFNLINHTTLSLGVKVDTFLEGVDNSYQSMNISLKPKARTSIQVPFPFSFNSSKTKVMLHAIPFIKSKGPELIQLPKYVHPIVPNIRGLIEFMKKDKKIIVVTDLLAITAHLEGGNTIIKNKQGDGHTKVIRFEAGPPYGINLDRSLLYDYSIKDSKDSLELILFANSLHIHGLEIAHHIKVQASVPEVEYWITYTNMRTTNIIATARTHTGWQGIRFSAFDSISKSYTPLCNKIVESSPNTKMISGNYISQDPEEWKETWTAEERYFDGSFNAWIWKPDNVSKISVTNGTLNQLESDSVELKPGQSYQPVHLWYLTDQTSIYSIRERWNQIFGYKTYESIKDITDSIVKPLEITLKDDNLVESGKRCEKRVQLSIISDYPLQGTLSLNVPLNWQAFFKQDNELQKEISIESMLTDKVLNVNVIIDVPKNVSSTVEILKIIFNGEFCEEFKIGLIVYSSGKINIKEEKLENAPVHYIDNGQIRFFTSKLGGILFRLENKLGQTFLQDNFPDFIPKLMLQYNIGGIQPYFISPSSNNPFGEPEDMNVELIEIGQWKGVKFSTRIEKQEILKDQEYTISYLTLPNSNVIKIIAEHFNPKKKTIESSIVLNSDIAINNKTDNIKTIIPEKNDLFIRNPSEKQYISQLIPKNAWVRFENGSQSYSIVVSSSTWGGVSAFDLGMLISGWLISVQKTNPRERKKLEFYVVVDESIDVVKRLQTLL